MATAIVFIILLVNQITAAQTSITGLNTKREVSILPEGSTEAVFALQIRQIRSTSEATPVASAGNNLNVVAASILSKSKDVQEGNFRAISTIYSFQNKVTDKKYDDESDKNAKLLSSFVTEVKEKNSSVNITENIVKASPLVWDSCLDTILKKNRSNISDGQFSHNNYNNGTNNKKTSSVWSKRETINANKSNVEKVWLEKYKGLKNSEMGETRQTKTDLVSVKKIDQISTTVTSTLQIIPITRDVFKEATESINITQEGVPGSNIIVSFTEDWFEVKDRSKIRFGGLPQTETYLIPTLRLEEGFHPFSFMSEFFAVIYPFDFPVGLIKDIVWGKFTFPYSFIQSIKVESTFLLFIITFICIALVIPSYLLVVGLLSLLSRSNCDDELETGALFPDGEDSVCNERVLVFVTLLVVVICCLVISGMTVSNEQAREAAEDSRNVINCACADISSWLASAARQLYHSLVPPVDMVLQAYRDDLRNVETLLGEPIHHAIASESGIDLVLDSLADIIAETEDLSSKISSLRDVSVSAGALALATSDKIKDFALQLDNLKKLDCNAKDMPLCDTINTHSLEVQMKFDLIVQEKQLPDLRVIGVENLTRAITTAKQEFRTLPSSVFTQTVQARKDILRDIEIRRKTVATSSRILNDIVRHLMAGLHSAVKRFDRTFVRAQKYDFWRWTALLACNVAIGFVMMLALFSMMCGCRRAKEHARRTLQVSTICLCFVSLILWSAVSGVFLLAGHAEVYICHALWDKPQYKTLTALLDRPSPLFSDNEGLFDAMFKDMNVTIDVSVRDILRDCEKDRPAYIVFQLDKVLDVNKLTSYFEWDELQADLGGLASSLDLAFLKNISVNFNRLLNEMLRVSDINLAKYRMDYNGPIVGKDLPSLIDQLENVAAQVTDLTTAGRLETLATRLQRLHTSNIKVLEQLRADLVYKLTELELQLMPFRRKLNISLSHIHTAQYYIDNQGNVIAQKKASMYVSRLLSHAAGWRTHVLTSIGKQAARCRPLFSVYAAARSLLCSRYVASLHDWWVCGFLLGVLWCSILTPLCVKLWRTYGRKIRAQDSMILNNIVSGSQQETPTTALCDDSNWNVPRPPPPPRSDSW